MRIGYVLCSTGTDTFEPAPCLVLTIAEAKSQETSQPAPEIPRLTAEMARGNEHAYQEFYELYFNRLLRYLLVVTRNEEQAREALQSTLLRVARHVRRFDSEPVFWNWLTVLARSSARDEGRRSRRYLSFLGRFFEQKTIEAEGMEAEADTRLRELLEMNMAALPPEERQLLEQKYFDRQSIRQMAEQMKSTERAVESRMMRLRRRLKDEIVEQLRHEK